MLAIIIQLRLMFPSFLHCEVISRIHFEWRLEYWDLSESNALTILSSYSWSQRMNFPNKEIGFIKEKESTMLSA